MYQKEEETTSNVNALTPNLQPMPSFSEKKMVLKNGPNVKENGQKVVSVPIKHDFTPNKS